MSDKTGIQWCDSTWNPLRGCSRVSEGCRHCYAEPRRIRVCEMSDLFHERVPDEWIDRMFAVMAISPQHTFQILTKRPERMRRYFENLTERTTRILIECDEIDAPKPGRLDVPLPNVWLGVSVEDQATAEARVPLLLQTPAAVRFVSYEPALGPVDFTDLVIERSAGAETHFDALTCDVDADDDGPYLGRTLDWIIVGVESGAGARPFDVAWIRSARDQCRAAGVCCFVKQLGAERKAADAARTFDVYEEGRRRTTAEEHMSEINAERLAEIEARMSAVSTDIPRLISEIKRLHTEIAEPRKEEHLAHWARLHGIISALEAENARLRAVADAAERFAETLDAYMLPRDGVTLAMVCADRDAVRAAIRDAGRSG